MPLLQAFLQQNRGRRPLEITQSQHGDHALGIVGAVHLRQSGALQTAGQPQTPEPIGGRPPQGQLQMQPKTRVEPTGIGIRQWPTGGLQVTQCHLHQVCPVGLPHLLHPGFAPASIKAQTQQAQQQGQDQHQKSHDDPASPIFHHPWIEHSTHQFDSRPAACDNLVLSRASNSSGLNGLVTKSSAPASKARAMSSALSRADNTNTGTDDHPGN